MENIFAYCSKLKYLDISNFRFNETHEEEGYNDIFTGLSSSGTMRINKEFYNKLKEQIPKSWNIQLIN